MELTPRSRQVLHAAAKAAKERGHTYIGTEPLLLGPLAEQHGLAAQVLQGLGGVEAVRTRLPEVMESAGYAPRSNRALDRDGNFLGDLVTDTAGRLTLVDEAGRPVRRQRTDDRTTPDDQTTPA